MVGNSHEGALFEVLNARKMSPREIANSFVISPQFESIVGPDHSFLVGPRGSGKTTVLRMLLDETLSLWDHPRAPEIRRKVTYSSIFIPADRLWSSQIGSATPSIASDEAEVRSKLGLAAFGTQLLSGFVETLQYRLDYFGTEREVLHPAELTSASEVELVDECARAWRLLPRTKTLNGLASALDGRFLRISEYLEARVDHLRVGEATEDIRAFGGSSPIEEVRFAIRTANRLTNQPNHRWALLLDEMELAPRQVHQMILRTVRGGERNLILKLSFSPFDNNVNEVFHGVGAASAHNDFVPVYLWSGDRRGGRKFADNMFRSMFKERIGEVQSPFRVLGPSQIDSSGRNWRPEDFEVGSKKFELMLDLQRSDQTFADYLGRRKIDLGRLDQLTYAQKSATLRKFFPILVFRDALLKFGVQGTGRRSRKKVEEVFSGQDVVYAALEANPRWMKAVFGQMLSSWDPARKRIPYGFQYDALLDAAERFESLLALLPSTSSDDRSRVLPLVNAVAKYFSQRALGSFSVDFPTTFVVDQHVPQVVHDSLRVALNAGAIVHVRGTKSPPLLYELRGERFRLAYLLSIRDGFEIPLRLGKSVNLSRILGDSISSSSEIDDVALFGEEIL